VVGAQVRPVAAHPVEQMHWRITNRLRMRESRRGGGAAVAAPCYMFRRSLLRTFPDDVVADDIHVTFAAALRGRRAVMIAGAVDELRTPQTLAALIGHKIRKSRAYLREVLRFLPYVGRMRAPVSRILLWRAAHLSIVPALVALEIALASARVASSSVSSTTAAAVTVTLVLLAVLAGPRRTSRLLVALGLTLVLTFAMLVALVSYPLMAQTASFRRLASPRRRGRSEEAI
jgi:cellulose synthase/poly-beta-1,6-N-acetylglucosamine synthase-like glycosyltransferase